MCTEKVELPSPPTFSAEGVVSCAPAASSCGSLTTPHVLGTLLACRCADCCGCRGLQLAAVVVTVPVLLSACLILHIAQGTCHGKDFLCKLAGKNLTVCSRE